MAAKSRDQLIAKRADHQTAHLLHLILSVITLGIWIPIWILVALSHANERAKIDRQLKALAQGESAANQRVQASASSPDTSDRRNDESNRVPCPECAERILPEAKRCRFCGADVSQTRAIQN